MNKQQLAAKIWESANKMRSKIEANEYKDYISALSSISSSRRRRLLVCVLKTGEPKTSRAWMRMMPKLYSMYVIYVATSSPTTTCSPRGLPARAISPSLMYVTRFPLSNATLIRLVNVCSLASSTRCKPVCPNSAPMKKVVARLSATSSTSSRTFRWTAGRTTTPSASSMSI